jgi:DNA-binding MarR family transcriptional regulator
MLVYSTVGNTNVSNEHGGRRDERSAEGDLKTNEIREFRRLVRRMSRQTGLLLQSTDCCSGVTVAQCHVLLELGDLGEVNLKDLASTLGLDKSTVSKAIEVLVSQELVARRPDPEDRRRVVISLSSEGARKVADIDASGDETALGILREVPRDKRRSVVEHLRLLVEAGARVEDTCREREDES